MQGLQLKCMAYTLWMQPAVLKKQKSPTAVQINIHIYNVQHVNLAFVQARYCRKCKLQLTRVKYYKVPVCSHEMSMHSCQCCHCVCELSRKPLPWNIYKHHELLAYLPDGKDEHLNANDEHNTGCSYKTKPGSIIFVNHISSLKQQC